VPYRLPGRSPAMTEITCISPIDGSVVARRPVAAKSEIAAAVLSARRAQREWAQVPIAERGRIMLRALDALTTMNGEVVPELARQMGRPVRYGGELRSVAERTMQMVQIAESATRSA
jgi:acyl-CoA reductase-like NAD-dependent aldehyde dehydrogenase